MSAREIRTYEGWRRERIGVVAGLPMGKVLALAVLAIPGVAGFAQQKYAVALFWMFIWVVVVGLVAIPVRGRSAWTWMVQGVVFLVARLMGITDWISRASEGDVRGKDVDDLDLPGVLQHLELVDGPPLPLIGLRQPCVIHDKRSGGAWRMVARVTHPGISMTTGAELDAQATGLGDMLASLALGGVFRRTSIYVRTEPSDQVHREAWLARHISPDAPAAMVSSVASLEAQVRAASISTDILVVVEVAESRIRRDARAAGGGVEGRARVIYRNLGEVQQGLMSAGATGVAWLTTGELVEAIRTGYEPTMRDELALADMLAAGGADVESGVAPIVAGPARAKNDFSVYRHGNFVTRSYTIVPPKRGTVVGSLAPLLAPSGTGERRTLAIHYEPIEPAAAQRRAEREVNEVGLASDARQRMGLRIRQRDRSQNDLVARQEQVISAGHTMTRIAMVCSVTVPASVEISDHAQSMAASARQRKFELLPLDLAQDAGFVAAVLPVGVGMPKRKGLV